MVLLFSRRKFVLAAGSAAALITTGAVMSHAEANTNSLKSFVKVSFPSGDGVVVANLYLPLNYDPSVRYPAAVIGGSMSSVKEQMSATYASELANRGVISLALDYRNYGESSGAKRQYEDQESKAEDLSAALRFLKRRGDVKAAGLVGICTSGGTVLYTAGKDPNVGAVATVAGFFSDPELTESMFGREGVELRREVGRKSLKRFEENGLIEIVPAYEPGNKNAASSSSSEYYVDQSRGGGVRAWRNEFATMSWEPWLAFNPVEKATRVVAPTLVIHSDGAAFPAQARKVFSLLGGPKDLYWTEGKHFDFYDDMLTVRRSAERIAGHFKRHLG